jgi:hypothetical protein
VDDYSKEIQDLQAQIEQLQEAEGDKQVIHDLQVQLDILQALYRQALLLLGSGRDDADLRHSLMTRGYGDWNLDNVYAFVYDTAVDLPDEASRSFAGEIKSADFASLLVP